MGLRHPVEQTCKTNRPHTKGTRLLLETIKLQVIFRKRVTNYRALVRKLTCKDKASYGSSPPCRTNRDQTDLTLRVLRLEIINSYFDYHHLQERSEPYSITNRPHTKGTRLF